jgi:hypothetical protein
MCVAICTHLRVDLACCTATAIELYALTERCNAGIGAMSMPSHWLLSESLCHVAVRLTNDVVRSKLGRFCTASMCIVVICAVGTSKNLQTQRNQLVKHDKMLGILSYRSYLRSDEFMDRCTSVQESPSQCEEAALCSPAANCGIVRY